jgi:hypothetical protein
MINLSIHHQCNLILSPQSTEYSFHLRCNNCLSVPFQESSWQARGGAGHENGAARCSADDRARVSDHRAGLAWTVARRRNRPWHSSGVPSALGRWTERLRRGQDRSVIGRRGCLWRCSGLVYSSILLPKSDGEGCGHEIRALRLPSPYAARSLTAGGQRLSPPRTPAGSLLGGFMLKRQDDPRFCARRPCSSMPEALRRPLTGIAVPWWLRSSFPATRL